MTEAKDDQRRGEHRAPITLRVEYKRINTFFADYTKNISRGGTFIRTTRPLEIGTEFMFVLALPEGAQLDLKGVVKWVVGEAEASDEKPAGMGIQFVFEDDIQRSAVERAVETMMNDSLGPILAAKLLRGRGEQGESGRGGGGN